MACGFFQLVERNYKLQPMFVSASITWITASLHVSLEYLSLFFILQPPVIVCVRNLLVPWNVCCSVVQLLKSSITFPPSSPPLTHPPSYLPKSKKQIINPMSETVRLRLTKTIRLEVERFSDEKLCNRFECVKNRELVSVPSISNP